jgi:hypothetical protein
LPVNRGKLQHDLSLIQASFLLAHLISSKIVKFYKQAQAIVLLWKYLDGRGISSTTLYIILGVAAGIILILLGVVLVGVFRRRDGGGPNAASPDRSKKGYVKGNVKGAGKLGKAHNPPDLWIHHDQMEMKGLDGKSLQRSGSVNTVSPSNPRRSQDLDSLDGMASGSTAGRGPGNMTNDSLDRRAGYVTAYAGSFCTFTHCFVCFFLTLWSE